MKMNGETTLGELAEHFGTTVGHLINALACVGPTKTLSRRILLVLRHRRAATMSAAEMIRMVDPKRPQQIYQRLAHMAAHGQIRRVSAGQYASIA